MLGAQTVVRRQRQANASAYLGYFIDHGDVLGIAQTRAPVFCIHQHPHEAHLAHFVKKFDRKMLGFIPIHDMGKDVLDSKVASCLADGVEVGRGMSVDGVQNGGRVEGLKGLR